MARLETWCLTSKYYGPIISSTVKSKLFLRDNLLLLLKILDYYFCWLIILEEGKIIHNLFTLKMKNKTNEGIRLNFYINGKFNF